MKNDLGSRGVEKVESDSSEEFDSTMFSSYGIFKLAKNSPNEEIIMMYKKKNVLQIFTGDGLVNNLFSYKCFADSIQYYHNDIFNIKEDTLNKATNDFILVFDKSKIIVGEYKEGIIPEKAEGLAEYRHKKPNMAFIKKATIVNSEIKLNKGVNVGMNIKKLFKYFFGTKNEKSEVLLNIISKVELYHIVDEKAPYIFFEFEDNILKSIAIIKEFETN